MTNFPETGSTSGVHLETFTACIYICTHTYIHICTLYICIYIYKIIIYIYLLLLLFFKRPDCT